MLLVAQLKSFDEALFLELASLSKKWEPSEFEQGP